MTQALLNKLSTTIEKTVNLAEKMPKTEGLDFGKIFEAKTNNYNKADYTNYNSKVDYANSAQKTLQNNIKKNNDEHQNNKKDVSEYKTAKNTTNNNTKKANTNTNNTTKQNSVQEKKENTVLDQNVVETDIKSDNENTENSITEGETTITDETIITEEEPTMYNEFNTLEDPTTMLLLQTQIQKNIVNCLDNEPSEDFAEENILKSQENLLNNTNLFKQFETKVSKDVNVNSNQFTQLSPKEMPQSKAGGTKLSDVISENIVKELNVEVISAQSAEAETSFGDLMQNQSPQEQAARVMIQGDVKFDATAEKVMEKMTVKPTTITPSKIIEQITKQLDGMVNNSKLNMVLNPGSLGKVNLQLMNTKDGLMAQFTVTTQDVKDILLKGLDGLKESLLAQGVNVDNVTVKLEETESEYNLDYTEQEGSKGGNKQQGAKHQKENEQTFEELMGTNTEEQSEV